MIKYEVLVEKTNFMTSLLLSPFLVEVYGLTSATCKVLIQTNFLHLSKFAIQIK